MSATLSTPKTTSGGEIIRELVNASDGQGLHFAAGGCINLANSAGGEFGLADFSIEFILDQDGDNVSNNYIWESHNAGNNRVRVWNELSSNVVTVRFVNSAGANTTFTLGYDMSADYGKPTHYAITCDRDGNATLYKNGNNVASVSISSTAAFDLGDSNTTTGIISNSSNNYSMLGTFYRFRTWNKSLSQAEVTDSYSNATVPFSDQYGSQTSLVDAAASVFTSGTYSWVAFGSNTVTNVSNTLAITYTGGSPRMEGAYNYLKETGYDLTTNLTVGKKYRVTFDAKYTGGSAGVKLRIFNITDNIDSDALTTSLVTYNLEFTANSATGCYLYLTGLAASNVVTIDNWYVREIGCVSDYDLAFANQKQSLVVEDRSGSKTDAPAGVNATGMMSASGVTQVTPIEQLNSKSARIGTSAATPADGNIVVDGQVLVDGGAEAAPSFAFSDDTNTGISHPTADTVNIVTGGTERVRVNSTGVGVGVTPVKALTASSLDEYTVQLNNPSAYNSGLQSGILFHNTYNAAGATTNLASIKGGKNNTTDYDYGGKLVFGTRPMGGVDTPRLTIDSAGNVGIGGSPAKLLDLHDATEPVLRLTNTKDWPSGTGNIGSLEFYTTDPSTPGGARVVSSVRCVNEAASSTPGGELVFSTAAGGGSGAAAVEHMRIDSAGNSTFSGNVTATGAVTAGALGTAGQNYYGANSSNTWINAPSGQAVYAAIDNGAITTVSSTGLAVTGAVSATTLSTFSAGIQVNGAVGSFASGIYFSGQTGTAATGATTTTSVLNHYEEGTFTATLKGSGAEPATLITSLSNYTRIGNRVYFDIGFENVDTTGYVNAISIIGFPFANNGARAVVSVAAYSGATWTTGQLAAVIAESGTSVNLYSIATNAGWSDATHNAGTGRFFWVSGSYKTDA